MVKKVGNFELDWTKSVTDPALIDKVEITLEINGIGTSVVVLDPASESYRLSADANSIISFSITTYGTNGMRTSSQTHTFPVGSLEAPQPATGLGHRLISVTEVDDGTDTTTGGGGNEQPSATPPSRRRTH